ncbi:DUF421 domain-containing protein [Lipingzhangella sp. LS1_29]|uniref:DUF421 domain-containing protein n=1 Tax=Lipingzhangella rawalii TaxID=2055835 RepID=A0ABU2H6L8_9ACTN|nr:YetF domain-containing protein [Lipingzhangella rawalii]MDS1270274.1 DUF421 domain-containing protein [Lipingzhangella rawalii]
MWQDLLVIEIPPWDKVLRTVLVYGAIVVLLRLAGKRDLAQLNTFDLVVMLLLSNIVQNALIGEDYSVTGGVLGAAVLLAGNAVMVRAAASWPTLGRLFEGSPTTLAHDGHLDHATLRRLGLRPADVLQAVKKQGADHMSDTERVTLEPGGAVLVRLRPEEENASGGEIAAVDARLARIERHLAELTGSYPHTPPSPYSDSSAEQEHPRPPRVDPGDDGTDGSDGAEPAGR